MIEVTKVSMNQYCLPIGVDDKKRLILDQILNQFKLENHGIDLIYTFIATGDCSMYMMEPYERQKQLVHGIYPDHSWCVEFYDRKDRLAEYLTEIYSAKSFTKVSSLVFPIQSTNGNHIIYIAGTLNMFNLTREFFKQNNLAEWPHTQLLLYVKYEKLYVKYEKDGKKRVF